jgi:hypothetical protein
MIHSSAKFSSCRRYRYSLSRAWNLDLPTIVFVGLNPSTADEHVDDATVRRCLGFARNWNYGGLVLVNLFAYRSTDPSALRQAEDPIGPLNDESIASCCRSASRVVVAWGIHGDCHRRDRDVLSLLSRPYCLGLTRNGAPKHPLYLAADTRLRLFRRNVAAATIPLNIGKVYAEEKERRRRPA